MKFLSYSNSLIYLIYAACVLMVFQNLAITVSTSRYDLSSFLILFSVFFFKKKKLLNLYVFFFFFLFLIIECLKFFYFQYADFYRFVSGIVWFGGIFFIYLKKDIIVYDHKFINWAILLGFFLTCFWFIKQFIFGMENYGGLSQTILRPRGFFDEPSYAGLFLYSISAAAFGTMLISKLSNREKFFIFFIGIISFLFGYKTLSMHIVTFALSIVISALIYMAILKNFLKKILILISIFFFILLFIFLLFESGHFNQRIQIINSDNLSVIAWLQGLDQALVSLNFSPVFGFGLGSTGKFDFFSENLLKLEMYDKVGQNRLDAYSMIFRLIVEMGFLFVLIILLAILKEYLNFVFTIKKFSTYINIKYYIFNFIFSASLLIGIFIKEPTYSRSYVYVGALLFFTASRVLKSNLKLINVT